MLGTRFPDDCLSDLRILVNVPSADEPHQQSNGERLGISLTNPSKEQLPAIIDVQNRGTKGGM